MKEERIQVSPRTWLFLSETFGLDSFSIKLSSKRERTGSRRFGFASRRLKLSLWRFSIGSLRTKVSCLITKFGIQRDLFGSRRTKVSSLRPIVSCFISKIFSVFIEKLSFLIILAVLSVEFGSPGRKFSCLRTKFGTQRTKLDYKRR